MKFSNNQDLVANYSALALTNCIKILTNCHLLVMIVSGKLYRLCAVFPGIKCLGEPGG